MHTVSVRFAVKYAKEKKKKKNNFGTAIGHVTKSILTSGFTVEPCSTDDILKWPI